MKHITILAGQTKIKVYPSQVYTGPVESYTVTVNGEEQTLRKNQKAGGASRRGAYPYWTRLMW